MSHPKRIFRLTRHTLGIAAMLMFLESCAPEQATEVDAYDAPKDSVSSPVIYGSDGRLDLYQVSDDALKRLADSTVALMKNNQLTTRSNQVVIAGDNYGARYGLCATENFREQNSSAFCSGSLVGEDTIITAGHCIQSANDCQNTSFVFGYAVKNSSVLPSTVAAGEVYRCKSIIKQVLKGAGADFAVIQLDRKVTNHTVLPVRTSGEAAVGDQLVVIGHPAGLPTKITTGGKVRSIANAEFLIASVDTYGGNSGSAVFNARTGFIEGILVRGETDFVRSPAGCVISNVCTEEGCRGEDITRISVVRSFIPSIPVTPPQPTPPSTSQRFEVIANLAIPDRNSTGISSQLLVSSVPSSRKVLISVNITHTYIGDLVVKVTSPSGQVALLHQRAGGSADNIIKTYEVTSILGGETQTGAYKITVQDLAFLDKGTLKSWSIEFK